MIRTDSRFSSRSPAPYRRQWFDADGLVRALGQSCASSLTDLSLLTVFPRPYTLISPVQRSSLRALASLRTLEIGFHLFLGRLARDFDHAVDAWIADTAAADRLPPIERLAQTKRILGELYGRMRERMPYVMPLRDRGREEGILAPSVAELTLHVDDAFPWDPGYGTMRELLARLLVDIDPAAGFHSFTAYCLGPHERCDRAADYLDTLLERPGGKFICPCWGDLESDSE